MKINELIKYLRSRINPAYAYTTGTESHERRLCAEALEDQRNQLKLLNDEIESTQNALRSVRYGVAWDGNPKIPIHKKMPDGYWVPWHVADLFIAGLKNDKSIEDINND